MTRTRMTRGVLWFQDDMMRDGIHKKRDDSSESRPILLTTEILVNDDIHPAAVDVVLG